MSERLSDEQVRHLAERARRSGLYRANDGTLAIEVQERRAVEAKLRELHSTPFCAVCREFAPCETIRLLDGGS